MDGVVSDQLGLAGKPDPAAYLETARRLGVEPARAVVVEDALSGVEAGRRGGFGLVIGVDRLDQADALREHGADVVVDDLAEVTVEADGQGLTLRGIRLEAGPAVGDDAGRLLVEDLLRRSNRAEVRVPAPVVEAELDRHEPAFAARARVERADRLVVGAVRGEHAQFSSDVYTNICSC